MPGGLVFGGSGGSIANLNTSFDMLGFTNDGTGTTITSSGTANTKGTYVQISASTPGAWDGFYLEFWTAGSSGSRFLVDVSIDGGTSVLCPDIYCSPGTATGGAGGQIWIPMAVAAASDLRIRCSSSSTSGTIGMGVVGRRSTAQSRPGYTTMTALNVDAANTLPDDTDIAINTSPTVWTELVASTAATYGALLGILGQSSAAPTLGGRCAPAIATGAAAAEAAIARWPTSLIAGTAPTTRYANSFLIEQQVASGSRLSANVNSNAATGNVRMALYGFS